jgi:hypothetical protein
MSAITYFRGDSYPIVFNIKQSGVAMSLTGYTFVMTVSAKKDPGVDDDPVFSVVGVNGQAVGQVSFTPTVTDTDQPPAKYFYDVEMTQTSTGHVKTIEKNTFTITQDISK